LAAPFAIENINTVGLGDKLSFSDKTGAVWSLAAAAASS
jgi:hypothetical protein